MECNRKNVVLASLGAAALVGAVIYIRRVRAYNARKQEQEGRESYQRSLVDRD